MKRLIKTNSDSEFKNKYNMNFLLSSNNVLRVYTLIILSNSDVPMFGKEILENIRTLVSSSIWNPSNGTFYPLLKSMTKDGYINKQIITKTKIFYEITPEGENLLLNMILEFLPKIENNIKFNTKFYDDLTNFKRMG
jgi:DNA-binding PadR family transcriptional regulator